MTERLALRAAAIVVLALVTACASNVPAAATATAAPSAPPVATPAPATSTPPPSVANASPTIASGAVTIEMAEHFYSPSFITVKVGTTVVWKVVGVQSHDVHARDGSFNSPLMAPGNTFTYTFTKAGKFPYYCAPHEGDGMFGEIDVVN
ncbi:MAG TPA: plastocyanin/azurin family copper-binding protein [Candidatus Acidoferrales bacterium]|nr:plastocyanin/azurin family copper-binding protein [Candidatus Acidoferrales bacterium]